MVEDICDLQRWRRRSGGRSGGEGSRAWTTMVPSPGLPSLLSEGRRTSRRLCPIGCEGGSDGTAAMAVGRKPYPASVESEGVPGEGSMGSSVTVGARLEHRAVGLGGRLGSGDRRGLEGKEFVVRTRPSAVRAGARVSSPAARCGQLSGSADGTVHRVRAADEAVRGPGSSAGVLTRSAVRTTIWFGGRHSSPCSCCGRDVRAPGRSAGVLTCSPVRTTISFGGRHSLPCSCCGRGRPRSGLERGCPHPQSWGS